jgi:UDP-3-O-[3-hydroxymyristoyl] glucosamine N-acyltransferase
MADKTFFTCTGPYSGTQLAQIAKAELRGNGDAEYDDVSSLGHAQSNHVSFLDNRKYVTTFKNSQAGLCIVHPDLADEAPEGMNLLLTHEPYMAYAKIARTFYPDQTPAEQISERAYISPTAQIGAGVCIEPGVYIGDNVTVGDRTWLKANCVLNNGVTIGEDCVISQSVTLSHSHISNAVTIHPGCQIGQDGFGFASGAQGHVRIPQLGRVIIHDHVNIGANSTIDRGAGPDTIIGAGTQIDNLVQIGHNVQLGQGCVIVSQVGISGSTKIGNFVVIAGQAGLAGHLEIGDGVTIAAKAGVMNNIASGRTVGGFPAITQKDWLRQISAVSKLVKKKN